MVMSWVYTAMLALAILAAIWNGKGAELATSVINGAGAGVTVAISMAGAICLWSGVGKLMEAAGMTGMLARIMRPLLNRLFPGTKKNPMLAGTLSANICANLLGLGNAATPMGIRAVQLMKDPVSPHDATDEMCRLIVLNTASIQLIPSTVAAVRGGLGCPQPFDILPAVWVTSICSTGLGLLCAWLLGKAVRRD